MGQERVTYRCGHEETVQMYGPHKARDRKVAWLKTTLCPACYAAEQASQRAVANADAAVSNKALGAERLFGSDAQVAWAETIRKPILDKVSAAAEHTAAHVASGAMHADDITVIRTLAVAEVLLSERRATWWIDHRAAGAQAIAITCLRERRPDLLPS